ncbi:hypothetical protein AVEN_81076-1 [Araneus ventricosus]|uniref:Uncharacterized protein n=1 Tax=Araneus ventricosus TaxID=182803 RepID=A0A4Y2NG39_ARAVE|nr:hypothetical protein AVEN_81076-1 [Araneus ventricosus]
MPPPYEKEMERLRKFLAEVETVKIQTLTMKTMGVRIFQKRFFQIMESFYEHDTESEEEGDSGNEDVNNLDLFSS